MFLDNVIQSAPLRVINVFKKPCKDLEIYLVNIGINKAMLLWLSLVCCRFTIIEKWLSSGQWLIRRVGNRIIVSTHVVSVHYLTPVKHAYESQHEK